MSETMRTPFASGENLTATGIVSPAAKALCGSVKEYMTLPGQVFSAKDLSASGAERDGGKSRTDFERLVELDRVRAKAP